MASEHTPTFTTRRGNFSTQLVGTFSIVFGLTGILCPLLFIAELGNISLDKSAGITLCIIPILAHLYLCIAGVRLLLKRLDPWLGYFFAIEIAYAIALLSASA